MITNENTFLAEELDANMNLITDITRSIIMKQKQVDRLTDEINGLEIGKCKGINIEICFLERKIINDKLYVTQLKDRNNIILEKILK